MQVYFLLAGLSSRHANQGQYTLDKRLIDLVAIQSPLYYLVRTPKWRQYGLASGRVLINLQLKKVVY